MVKAATMTAVLLLSWLLFPTLAHAQEPFRGEADIVFIGAWDRVIPLLERASRETEIPMDSFRIEEFLEAYESRDIGYRLIYVLNLNQSYVPGLVKKLQQAKASGLEFQVVSLDERDSQVPLEKADLLQRDATVNKYWKYNGLINMKRLLQFSSSEYLGNKQEVLAPVVIPDFGLYHPKAKDVFPDAASFRSWYQNEGAHTPAGPWVIMLIHQSFWVTGDTNDLDALIYEFEKQGVNIATVFGDTVSRIKTLVVPLDPQLFLLQVHVSLVEGGEGGSTNSLRDLGIPFLKPISLLGSTVEEWLQDPRGLTYRDVGLHLTMLEVQGMIEPNIIGGLAAKTTGFRVHKAIPDRIEHFVQRALSWIALRKKKDAEKKVAVVYYHKNLGKSDVLRGSPTGAYLDGPQSLVAFLRAAKREGYDISKLPQDEKELLQWCATGGRNIGPWAHGELIDLVEQGDPVLIPLATYKTWFRELPESLQNDVIKNFGPPPGRLMVYEENNTQYIVIPRIDLGNVILLPQPLRGEVQDETILHNRDIPPPHNYIAFYLWLQKEFKADAIVHFGTHGTLELMPTKASGLSKNDWGDILLGRIPNINPWILDNLGEATLAKRRAYAVLVNHLVPPIVGAGLSADYKDIHDEIDKFETLEDGLLREQFRKSILQRSRKIHLFKDIDRKVPETMSDEDIDAIAKYLHEIYNDQTPIKLHVLGNVPAAEDLIPYITSILGLKFLDELSKVITVPAGEDKFGGDREKYLRLKAEPLLRSILIAGDNHQNALQGIGGTGEVTPGLKKKLDFASDLYRRFSLTPQEIENIFLALAGKYVPPGPGNDPVRNPSSIPTGRNMYAVNPEEIPVRPAWETAKIVVDQMLQKKLQTEGHYPKKVGIDLNGHDTMRHYGVTEGQILYLLGVRPVWNENNLVIDVELISKDELQRPRIDVFIAMGGTYRDNFPSRVELLDKAVRLVAGIEEDNNYVRDFTLQMKKQLLEKQFSEEAANRLSKARIFGSKPGEFGTRILHLIPRSGVWDQTQEITAVYKDTMSHVYTQGTWGKKVEGLYEVAMTGTDTIIRTWASNMSSPLTNHHFYEYLGGLNLAVNDVTGDNPTAYVADVRNPDRARVETFERILQQEFRVRLFNKKWIEGMMTNDYAGAGQMAELVKNTFGWKVTRPESVRDDTWEEIVNIYMRDKYQLDMKEWFERENPHAVQEMAATLLEAARKGFWDASEQDLQDIAQTFVASVAKHGLSAGLITGGNEKLIANARKLYSAPGANPQPEVLTAFENQLQHSKGPESSTRIKGNKLEKQTDVSTQSKVEAMAKKIPMTGALVAMVVLLFIFIGYRMRRGIPQ